MSAEGPFENYGWYIEHGSSKNDQIDTTEVKSTQLVAHLKGTLSCMKMQYEDTAV